MDTIGRIETERVWTRRGLLRVGGTVLIGSAAAVGCDPSTDPVEEEPGGTKASGTDLKEAPELAALVEQGALPPVEERLPENPLVVDPVESVGVYGGEWRTSIAGPANASHIGYMCGYNPLLRWALGWTGAPGTDEIEPNVAESFQVDEAGTGFTFQLRAGMRWSDGEPFTADDVVFAMDDVLLNEELTPVLAGAFSMLASADGEAPQIVKVDDYTFRIVFSQPNGLSLLRAATFIGGQMLIDKPFHYLRQYHKDHNPDIDELVEQEGVEDWVALFQNKGDLYTNAERPTLWAWQITEPLGEGNRVVLERNPYYWKTDPDGRQLPYLDRVVFEIVDDEVQLLKLTSGDHNLEVAPDISITSLRNKPVFGRNREEGDYRFIEAKDTRMSVMQIMFNLSHQNPVKREIFSNKDFRIGLSHAINRQEIIDATLQGQGEPYQAAPLPDSVVYDEEFATQYLEYDEAKANEYLDRAGYAETNSDGLRLGPDGNPIVVSIEFVPAQRTEFADILALIKDYWRAVGVELRLNGVDQSLFTVRVSDENGHDAVAWPGGGGLGVVLDPRFYFPFGAASYFAPPWGVWYASAGREGEEPPPEAKHQMELYDQLVATVDSDQQINLLREIITISKQQFYSIGTARPTEDYFIASNEMRNIPEPITVNFIYSTPGPTNPEQYFIDS